jgi:hypothetical protein
MISYILHMYNFLNLKNIYFCPQEYFKTNRFFDTSSFNNENYQTSFLLVNANICSLFVYEA